MANGVVESGRTCAFISSSTLIDHLRTLLIDDNALFNEEINKYKNVEVLIIDDLGGEKQPYGLVMKFYFLSLIIEVTKI